MPKEKTETEEGKTQQKEQAAPSEFDLEEGEELSEEELAKYLSGEGAEKDMEEGEGEAEEDGKKEEGAPAAGKVDDAEEGRAAAQKTHEDLLKEQLAESRRTMAEMQKQMQALEQRVASRDKKLQEHGIIEEPSEEDQNKARAAQQARQEDLAQLEEMIRLNPKYADYDQVVTTSNEEELISFLTKEVYAEHAGEYSMSECEQAIRDSINNTTNPFRFKYEAIKKFKEGSENAATADKGKGQKEESKLPETKKQTPKPAEAPATVQNTAGASKGATYTAERLDNMSSEELEKVPDEIREKWVSGVLD